MAEPVVVTALLVAGGYLVGSPNFALGLHRLGWIPDPRAAHSGNPGASNVYRVAGPAWAAVVLLLDLARALGLALLALRLAPLAAVPLIGAGLVAGNRWPLLHGFRGGKGVAALLGFTAAVAPWAGLAAAAAWVITYGLARLTFVASFAMVAGLAAGLVHRCGPGLASLLGTAAILVMIGVAHRENVARFRRERRPAAAPRTTAEPGAPPPETPRP